MPSASERLRELDGAAEAIALCLRNPVIPNIYDADARAALDRLRLALPLIADVVEATEDLAAWSDEQQAATGAEMVTSVLLRIERGRVALSALREALEEK